MRTIIRALGIAAAVSTVGVANAGDPYQVSPESRAYIGFSFGGDKVAPRELHYGLRVDQDSRFSPDAKTPSILQFDFTRRGFGDARVNGLSVLKREYRLRQNDSGAAPADGGAAAAPAEDEGFFSGMWHGITGFFGGLFGSKDETPADAAPAESAPAPAEASAGGWSAVDWGLLAVGVAGVAAAGAQTIGKDETPDANAPGGVNNSGSGSGTPPPACIIPGIYPPGCVFTSTAHGTLGESKDVSRQDWLDDGTGHMGDLSPQN